ncbi:MAG: ThuA domain-containing protein [Chloroflexota bacterium]|nr:ThuA domain-containing protein [Chloroflexota bacterium]
MKRALIVQGGWEGHKPREVANLLAQTLRENVFQVEVSDTLDAFKDKDLEEVDLIVPIWTMGHIELDQLSPFLEAVRGGTGIAGVHGGMADAFRDQPGYQYMVGGQWVAHPGGDGVTYEVNITDVPSPITEGIEDFTVTSEQYYMHVDPGNTVLATTRFACTGGDVVMPVVWTKTYGQGRVFYCSLGHSAEIVRQPEVLTMVTRGMIWAAKGRVES